MSQPDLKWSCVDPMLWSLAFSGKGKVNRCRHYFSLTHSSSECEWNPGSQTSSASSPPILGSLLKPSEGFQLFVMFGKTLQPPIVPTQIASMSSSAPYVLERSEQPMCYTKPFTAQQYRLPKELHRHTNVVLLIINSFSNTPDTKHI